MTIFPDGTVPISAALDFKSMAAGILCGESKTKLEILKYTAEFFTKNGYKMIGMDHFANPGDEVVPGNKAAVPRSA